MKDYPRHKTGRAYARLLEVMGYVVAVAGSVGGVIIIYQVGLSAGLGYLLGAIVTGIGLYVLGEIVLVLFHIEYNTTVMRQHIQAETSASPPLPRSRAEKSPDENTDRPPQ